MVLMTKEATDKDQSLKIQMLLSTAVNSTPEKISREQVWKKMATFLIKKPTSILTSKIFQKTLSATSTRGTSPWLRGVN